MKTYVTANTGMLPIGGTRNLGITFAANVFTICAANGTALSVNNPGWVCVPSITAGQNIELPIVANVSFNDDTHASPTFLANMGCGITTTVDWAQDMPWFLYVVNVDDTAANLVFGFSRNPCATTTESHANINFTDVLGTQSQRNLCVIKAHVDAWGDTPYPVQCLGSFRMRYDTASDGWTVQTLDATDGFGKFKRGSWFIFPLGQNGASATNTYQHNANANTCGANMVYSIGLDGRIYLGGNATWAGAGGATNVTIVHPLAKYLSYSEFIISDHANAKTLNTYYNGSLAESLIFYAGTAIQSNTLNGIVWGFCASYRAF